MKVPPHFISLYNKTARRYKKVISKIQRETASSYKRKTLLHQLKKLAKRLQDLQLQLKLAIATGTVVLLLNAAPGQAQTINSSTLGPFVKQSRENNPLREPIFNGQDPALAALDFDMDGDLDVVLGEYDSFNGGFLRYFENTSSAGMPLYTELLLSENPFDGIHATTRGVAPAFADIDKDGDLDLFLGQNGWYAYNQTENAGVEYYRNDAGTFSKQTGAWDSGTKTGNPFDGVTLGDKVRPVFIDYDHDGDIDLLIGSEVYTGAPLYTTRYVHYFDNDGNGNFTSSEIILDTSQTFYGGSLNPALADFDDDGDYDMVIGNRYDGQLRFYKQVNPASFVEETGPFDPIAKTGNPFDGFDLGFDVSPLFIDFNNDGKPDLFVADENGYNTSKYSDNIINYYKNSGNNEFTEIAGFENPFDGVYVKGYASPVLFDIDGDNELDAVIGNKYTGSYWDYDLQTTVYSYSTLAQYKKNEDVYEEIKTEDTAFEGLEVDGYFAPQFADVDGDADLDIISGGDYGQVVFFRNDGGVYTEEIEFSPFAGINVGYDAGANLVDIDNDTDLDLFMTNGNGEIHYYRNEGTIPDPQYIEQFTENHPLDSAADFTMTGWTPILNFTDIDHDGDLDLLFQGIGSYQGMGQILYFENTGTTEMPVFEQHYEGLFPSINNQSPQLDLADHDQDGDLDAFVGVSNGTVMYLENQNEIVTTEVTGAIALFEDGGSPVMIEPNLVLTDPDNDLIIQATVAIEDFQAGETLSFIPQAGISGNFDGSNGVLTFRGKGTVGDYQSLLRTVTFEIIDPEGGRQKPYRKSTTAKNISYAVFDADFTYPQVVPKTLNVFINTPPEIQPESIITLSGAIKVINLLDITSDVDDNLDPTLFTIVKAPFSKAVATISEVSSTEVNLQLDYEGITFKGTDQLTIRACDELGACTESILSVEVDYESQITVYNAVAPNSSGDNKFMRIMGLPEANKISIYNRWGDKVFDAENYQDILDGNVFKGLNKNGNALPSGTYFYTIEIPGKKMMTGYLTLKQ